MGQGRRHYNLCDALYQMLCAVCVPEHTVGADQFVYFDASAPRRCLAPDAFVTLGVPDHDFDSYLVWEEGTPRRRVRGPQPERHARALDLRGEAPSLSRARRPRARDLPRRRARGRAAPHLGSPRARPRRARRHRRHEPVRHARPHAPRRPGRQVPGGPPPRRDAEGHDLVLTEKEGRLAESRAREAAILAARAETLARQKAEARVAELREDSSPREAREAAEPHG